MLKAILFDMDGTLTRPHINWPILRARVGAPQGVPILAHLESLPPPQRQAAEALLLQTEMEAAEQAVLNPGAVELLRELRARSLKLALITNNHRSAMQRVVEKFALSFDLLLSREDAPFKPAPHLLLLALEKFGLRPEEACSVGDSSLDHQASQAAGIPFVRLVHDSQEPVRGPAIRQLSELWEVLRLHPP